MIMIENQEVVRLMHIFFSLVDHWLYIVHKRTICTVKSWNSGWDKVINKCLDY